MQYREKKFEKVGNTRKKWLQTLVYMVFRCYFEKRNIKIK